MQLADTTSPVQRALILEDLVRIVYGHVKFRVADEGGVEGLDGPEHTGVRAVLAAATDHVDDTRLKADPPT